MRRSRDAWVLVAILVAFGVGVYYNTVRSAPTADTPSSNSTGKRGTKAYYMLLVELGFRVARHCGPLDAVPKDACVAILVDPEDLSQPDAKALARWVKSGGTLVLAASRFLQGFSELGLSAYPRAVPEVALIRPERLGCSAGVRRVRIEAQMTVLRTPPLTRPIVSDDEGMVVAEHQLGKGRVVFFTDPLMLANSMIREEDNVVLLTNLVYERAGKNGLTLFIERGRTAFRRGGPPPALGPAGKLALAQLAFTSLLVLISAGRRFGAVHPLPERFERRRGWEFVRAAAGLYRRAEAREVALAAIYQSFRRELAARFGISPSAAPAEAAEAVLRARQVDRARLTALLARCDRVASGQKTSDGEMIALVRSIEEFREELGNRG